MVGMLCSPVRVAGFGSFPVSGILQIMELLTFTNSFTMTISKLLLYILQLLELLNRSASPGTVIFANRSLSLSISHRWLP